MSEKSVIILIPVYNGSKFIEKTIDSCLNQTYSDFSIVIIDDKSSDESLEIIKRKYSNLSKITILENDINSGINVSINKALKFAQGSIIIFLGQDDLLLPNHLEIMTKDFNDSVSFVHCNSRIIDENDQIIVDSTNHDKDQVKKSEKPLIYLSFENFVSSTGALINKKIFMEIGGFDESYKNYGEWLNWIKLASHGKVIYNRNIRALYRKHLTNISNSFIQSPPDLVKYWEECKIQAKNLYQDNKLDYYIVKTKMVTWNILFKIKSSLFSR